MGDASPGGKQVGKVSIRVVPDATGFRKDLEKQLKGKENVDDVDVPVKAVLDDKQTLARKVKAQAKEAGKDATVPVDADTTKITKSLDRFKTRYLNKFNRTFSELEANIPLTVDGEAIRRDLEGSRGAFKALVQKITPELDDQGLADVRRQIDAFYRDFYAKGRDAGLLDMSNADAVKRSVRSLQAFIAQDTDSLTIFENFTKQSERAKAESEKIWSNVDATLRIKVDDGQITKINRRLSDRIVVPVNIKENFDRGGLTRALATSLGGLKALSGGILGGISEGIQAVGSGATSAVKGFASLSQGIMLFIAVVALIAPALALASGALVAIPALLAGLLVPIGAVMLGLDGIKKAAENAGLFSDTNGQKKGGGEIGEALKEIKKQVSDTFERGLTPAFKKIGELANYVKGQFAGVANGLSELFNGFTDALTSADGKDQISNTIKNIGDALARARPGLRDFTTGILELVSELSNKFPGLADAFNRTGRSFLEWVDKITTKDPVTQVSQLDTAMSTLGDTLSGIGGIVSDLFTNGFDNLSSETFGASMESFVDSIDNLVNDVLPGLASAFETIAAALEPIVDAIDAVQNTWDFLLPESSPGGIPDWVPLLGSWDNILLDWFGDGSTTAGDREGLRLAMALREGLTAGVVGGAKLGVDGNIVPVEKISSAIQGQLAQIDLGQQAEALKSVFEGSGVTDEVRNNINTQMQEITTAVVGSLTKLGPEIDTAVETATASLKKLPEQIKLGLQGAISGVQSTIVGMFALITLSIATQSSKVETEFTTAFSGIGPAIGRALSNVPASIADALGELTATVRDAFNDSTAAADEGGANVAAAARASFAAVPAAVQEAMAPCITAVATICGQMVNTALSYRGAMVSAGESVGSGFAEGLSSQNGLVARAAAALMAAARNNIPSSPAKEGPFSGKGWVTYSGKSVGEGFAAGLEDSSGGVVSTTRELMQAVKDIFGDASGLTLNFNLGAAAMGSMAEDAQKFNSSMSSAASSLGTVKSKSGSTSMGKAAQIDTQSQAELDTLKWEQERLGVMQDMLGLQTRGASEAQKAEIKRQQDLLGLQKDRLNMQGKELEYWSKYEDKSRDYNDAWSAVGDKAQGALTDFGKSVGQQAMSDLGISGQGAVSNLISEGSKYVFNVMDMTSAMSAQKTFEQRESLTYTQR